MWGGGAHVTRPKTCTHTHMHVHMHAHTEADSSELHPTEISKPRFGLSVGSAVCRLVNCFTQLEGMRPSCAASPVCVAVWRWTGQRVEAPASYVRDRTGSTIAYAPEHFLSSARYEHQLIRCADGPRKFHGAQFCTQRNRCTDSRGSSWSQGSVWVAACTPGPRESPEQLWVPPPWPKGGATSSGAAQTRLSGSAVPEWRHLPFHWGRGGPRQPQLQLRTSGSPWWPTHPSCVSLSCFLTGLI